VTLPHRYRNSHAIWNRAVLHATRQRWHSLLYSQPKLLFDLAPRTNTRLSWPTHCSEGAVPKRGRGKDGLKGRGGLAPPPRKAKNQTLPMYITMGYRQRRLHFGVWTFRKQCSNINYVSWMKFIVIASHVHCRMMFPNLRRIFNILSQLCSRSAASAYMLCFQPCNCLNV